MPKGSLFSGIRSIVMIFPAVIALFFTACEKPPGPGGKATVNVHVVDSIRNMGNTEVYIKYGVNTYPGEETTLYNASAVTDYAGFCAFKDLTRGDYYVMSRYTDSTGTHYAGAKVLINNKPYEQHVVIDFGQEDPF